MFAFDQSQLPKIFSRKAFIGVDFQNDFTSTSGALTASEPNGYVGRAAKLAELFRACGNPVIWTKSCHGTQPVPLDDRILATDTVSSLPTRGRRRPPALEPASDGPPDEEAFLSHAEPSCLRPDSEGSEFAAEIQSILSPSDVIITNPDYSAFKDTALLRILRSKMVMEVFICGSLINVGVYATAIEAAGHGMAITIVEDCCGYRSDQRQAVTFSRLNHLTGCDIITAKEVSESLKPATRSSAPIIQPIMKGRKSETAPSDEQKSRSQSERSPDLGEQLSNLQLDSRSPKLVASQIETDTASTSIKKDNNANATEPEEVVEEQLLSREKEISPSAVIEGGDSPSDETTVADVESQKGLCAGDTDVIENVLPRDLEEDAFEKLRTEVSWQRMSHQGGEVPRLVAVQGEVGEDGSMPVYRHPSDESPPLLPFTPTVRAIKEETEKHLGHPLNHVLIQFYRTGNDYISEHSDKTIDIVKDSYIANVSLGAQRTMVLRTKREDKNLSETEPTDKRENTTAAKPTDSTQSTTQDDASSTKRQVQRATLRHNSLCRMGLKTNMQWLHSIRQDKRADRDKSSAELAFGGGRISLTFRRIGTFLNQEETLIWGQGATGKTKDEAHAVINGESPEMVALLKAFGRENHSSVFDWDAHYGKGFDVLHMSNAPRFFASRDPLVNMRIALMLSEYGIGYAKGSMTASKRCSLDNDQLEAASVRFVDSDPAKSVVQGDIAIMLYLHDCYGPSRDETPSKPELARHHTMFQRAHTFLTRWHRARSHKPGDLPDLNLLKDELAFWEATAVAAVVENTGAEKKAGFLSGSATIPGLVDYALWPVLDDMLRVCGPESFEEYSGLMGWYEELGRREGAKSVVRAQAKA